MVGVLIDFFKKRYNGIGKFLEKGNKIEIRSVEDSMWVKDSIWFLGLVVIFLFYEVSGNYSY